MADVAKDRLVFNFFKTIRLFDLEYTQIELARYQKKVQKEKLLLPLPKVLEDYCNHLKIVDNDDTKSKPNHVAF